MSENENSLRGEAPDAGCDIGLDAIDLQLYLADVAAEIAEFRREAEGGNATEGGKATSFAARETYIAERLCQLEADQKSAVAKLTAVMPGQTIPLQDATLALCDQINKGQTAAAHDSFAYLARAPIWLEGQIATIRKRASPDGLGLLFDLFVNDAPGALSRLRLIANAAEIGIACGRRDKAFRMVAKISKHADGDAVRFGSRDILSTLVARSALDRDFRKLLSAIKYRGVSIKSAKDVFAASDVLGSRIDLDRSLTTYLFERRSDRSMAWAEWYKHIQTAAALAHLTDDQPTSGSARREAIYDKLIADGAAKAFDAIDSSAGLLLVTFHGGFLRSAVDFFDNTVAQGTVLKTGKSETGISIKNDPRAALILAIRAVLDGRTILMAADGRRGNTVHSIQLFERSIPMAAGGALIAYESGCPSAWYTLVPQDGRLVPVLTPGPRPEKGERFDDFARRWLAFYQQRLSEVMTGDPRQIAFRKRWDMLSAWDKPGKGTDRDRD